MAIVNSFILHQQLKLEKISLKNFRRRVVDGLLAPNQLQTKKKNHSIQVSHHKPHVAPEVRFESSAHQPTRGTLRRCALCSTKAKQKRTEWLCETCNIPLCLRKKKLFFIIS